MKVLLVEDDDAQAEAILQVVEELGCDVSGFKDGATAQDFLQKNRVDLVILDWKLPGVSGLDVVRWIRTHLGGQMGVLFLTCNTLEAHVVQALDSGADDYMTKPFRRAELASRMKALLRRVPSGEYACGILTLGHYTLDFNQRAARFCDQRIELTEKEFDLASILFRNSGRVISRDALARLAWGSGYDGSSRAIDTHISRIRRKLALCSENGIRLNSVYTHGYRLMVSDAQHQDSQKDHLEKRLA